MYVYTLGGLKLFYGVMFCKVVLLSDMMVKNRCKRDSPWTGWIPFNWLCSRHVITYKWCIENNISTTLVYFICGVCVIITLYTGYTNIQIANTLYTAICKIARTSYLLIRKYLTSVLYLRQLSLSTTFDTLQLLLS